jgi:ABC-type multidrug transport system fused ATPase/permease subunit
MSPLPSYQLPLFFLMVSPHDCKGLEIRLNANIPKIQTALATKLALFFANTGTGAAGLGIAFYSSAKLAGVFFASMLPMFIVFGITAEVMQDVEGVKAKIYEDAGVVGEEVLSLVRTVMTFGTYDREEARYDDLVRKSADKGKAVGRKFGMGMGMPPALLNLQYAIAFWYGAKLIREGDDLDAGHILTALFCMMMGTMMRAMTSEYFQTAGIAQAAAFPVFSVIDRQSKIDGLSDKGAAPEDLRGDVSLNKVSFSYPTAPDTAVLDELSFSVERGKTVALIGHSGCGKSTVIKLLMRFYSPTGGGIDMDNTAIEGYNVGWLRKNIGLVQQMPTLLPGSIADNIRLGKADATDAEVFEAARLANAHEFIQAFPSQYETDVGSLGGKLSGGQKQRIAIARTLISKPRILLLDEATSALDSKSEAKFIDLLEETKQDRTTVVIAHRLATVKKADEIIALGQGKVMERGTHEELYAKQGFYYNMLQTQEKNAEEDKEESVAQETETMAVDSKAVKRQSTEMKMEDEVEMPIDEATTKKVTDYVWSKSKPMMGWIVLASVAGLVGGIGYGGTNAVLAMIIQKVLMNTYADPSAFTCQEAVTSTFDMYAMQTGAGEAFNASFPSSTLCLFYGCTDVDECWGCLPLTEIDGVSQNESYVAVGRVNGSTCTQVDFDNAVDKTYTTTDAGTTMTFGAFERMIPAGDPSLIDPLCVAFVVIFLVMFGGRYLQYSIEYVAGEKLVAQLRSEFYGVFIRKGAGYHDRHMPSELTVALAVGADEASNFYAHSWPKQAQILGIVGSGVGIAFYYCPMLGLVMLGGLPLLVVGGALETMAMLQNTKNDDPTLQEATVLSGTIISNLAIITSLGRAKEFVGKYAKALQPNQAHMSKQAITFGIYGMIFQFTVFGVFALAFWYAGNRISKGECETMDAIAALLGIMFAGFQAGQDASLLPDKGKALRAMAQAYDLVHDNQDDSKHELTGESAKLTGGKIEFENVKFHYPTRPEAEVLKGLSFTIEAGTTVAIVGASGGGKSTILGLLQKLYHPSSGKVMIDGFDVSSVHRDSLRSQLAVVPQEPKLFNISVSDNIAYRPTTLSKTQSQEAVAKAAKAAHASEFVRKLEDGFDYLVGRFGSKLSGGQCQRVAIARSIYGPETPLLLLDEATSALDNESEVLVQNALTEAMKGRTTVIVAHRLSTIQDADKIIVLEEGKVAEEGTFTELKSKKGVFWSLYESAL